MHPSYPPLKGGCCLCDGHEVNFQRNRHYFVHRDFASNDGTTLIPYLDTTLTIGGEINKLAFNVPMGRGLGRVNYRSDIAAGHMIGEEAAICFLQDVNTLSEPSQVFFTKFDGTPICFPRPERGPYAGMNLLRQAPDCSVVRYLKMWWPERESKSTTAFVTPIAGIILDQV